MYVLRRDAHALQLPLGDAARDLAADATYLALQLTQARLLRVLVYDCAQSLLRDVNVLRRDAVLLYLLRQKMSARDLQLLLFGVACEADDLHSVAKGWLHGVEYVGRRHEHRVREVERDAEVVVAETVVLLWVENFEQSGRRVAAKIGPDLVNLVEHDERVVRARLLQRLNYPAGHRADVRAAVSANFRLVVQAAEREAYELAVESARD